MTAVFDVAVYLYEKLGAMSTMKLQKMVYYSQAWSLVFDNRKLFEDDIEAWANGPVVRTLFDMHRGMYTIGAELKSYGNSDNLDSAAKETIDKVIEAYGHLDANQLIALTHKERPWREAREGVPDFARCDRVISTDTMQEYYSARLVA